MKGLEFFGIGRIKKDTKSKNLDIKSYFNSPLFIPNTSTPQQPPMNTPIIRPQQQPIKHRIEIYPLGVGGPVPTSLYNQWNPLQQANYRKIQNIVNSAPRTSEGYAIRSIDGIPTNKQIEDNYWR